nr:hypothetical protein Iba_chr06fCG5780 [Ipomoea batatas]
MVKENKDRKYQTAVVPHCPEETEKEEPYLLLQPPEKMEKRRITAPEKQRSRGALEVAVARRELSAWRSSREGSRRQPVVAVGTGGRASSRLRPAGV